MKKLVMCIFLALSSVFFFLIDGIILAAQKIISGSSAVSRGTSRIIGESAEAALCVVEPRMFSECETREEPRGWRGPVCRRGL